MQFSNQATKAYVLINPKKQGLISLFVIKYTNALCVNETVLLLFNN